MRSIWIIAHRELAAFFDSIIAYVILIIFLGITGFFTWIVDSNIFLSNQADLAIFFQLAFFILAIVIPAITMRTLAEETKSGTIELLSTKAITDWEIVTGKFLACLMIVALALVCSLPYYITVSYLGDVDHGGAIGGYLGLLLLSAAYIGIGILASSLTNNQIVAFLLALIGTVSLNFLFGILASGIEGTSGQVFHFLSARTHFDSLSRGVIDSRDLLFFLSIVALGLVLATSMLSRRNWQS